MAHDRARTDHQLAATEPWPDGAIHHFLLPADGWGAVAGERRGRKLAPEDAKRLGDWRRRIKATPVAKRQDQPGQPAAGGLPGGSSTCGTWYSSGWSCPSGRSAATSTSGAPTTCHPSTGAVQRDKIKADLRGRGRAVLAAQDPDGHLVRAVVLAAGQGVPCWTARTAVYARTTTLVTRPTVIEERVSADLYEKTPLPFDIGAPEQPTLPANDHGHPQPAEQRRREARQARRR